MSFIAPYDTILNQIDAIDPVAYGSTRNFLDGAVTRLSPYISRGVISTKQVMKKVLNKGYAPATIEKFLQELAWRDYWQHVWIAKGEHINSDLKQPQPDYRHDAMPTAIIDGTTGIEAVDNALKQFHEHGYLHNHIRMYVAALACNMGKSHWKVPAKWLYYHLIDGDWASNALSWQWVAGANANKKYYANQENINKYCYTSQKGTYLDVPYSQFETMDVPMPLQNTTIPELITPLPAKQKISIDPALPTLLYNYYNLDPSWHSGMDANRILLLEPSVFSRYPVSQRAVDFMLGMAQYISGMQVFVGELSELEAASGINAFVYKEHPLNGHYKGREEARDWMFSVTGYYPSFFGFWKMCKKELT